MLERDSSALSQRQAAEGLLRGGLAPEEVGEAVRRTGARVVHAHNVNPTLGWRALAAAREAGARVVLHLHNYRLVCAVGTCFTHGEDCTRCHGRNTLPGRAAQLPRRLAGGVGRLRRLAGAVAGAGSPRRPIASSSPARSRCGACASSARRSTTARACCGRSSASSPRRSRAAAGRHVLYAGRLSHEKGVADAVRRLPRRRAAARRRRRRAGGRRAPRARRGRRRALHRQGRRRRRSPSCAATPPSPSSPPATRRSCRSPRSRRWRRACRSSPRARAAWPSSCPEEGLYPPGDVAALAARACAGCGATRRRATARSPSCASAARPRRSRGRSREVYA